MIDTIRQRFHSEPVTSLVARADLRHPLVFSHVVGHAAMPAPTGLPAEDQAYALHVHHRSLGQGDMWIGGRHQRMPHVADGGLFIFDLGSQPTAQIHEGFEFSRFHLPHAALDDLAYEQGLPRLAGLRAADFAPDLVVKHLALALLRRLASHGADADTLYTDAVMLALFAHVTQSYGGVRRTTPRIGTLPAWQVRRVADWVDARLQASITTADLAALLDLSPSHFSRAFRLSVGMPPHQWVLRRRVARAKLLLQVDSAPLSDIAASCGFVDQSHFTNVFLRLAGTTPGRWRRHAG